MNLYIDCQYLDNDGYCNCRECEYYGEDVASEGISDCECFDAS